MLYEVITFLLRETYRQNWLIKLLRSEGDELKALAEATGANEASIGALKRKLSRLKGMPFFKVEHHAVVIILRQLHVAPVDGVSYNFV